jgi:hypothetical protein
MKKGARTIIIPRVDIVHTLVGSQWKREKPIHWQLNAQCVYTQLGTGIFEFAIMDERRGVTFLFGRK